MTHHLRRVSFWPRPMLELITPPTNSVLISVYDVSQDPLDAHAGWKDVLKLRFHDTDGQQLGLEVFSNAQARAVLKFLKTNEQAEQIFVHCAAGQSRSAAIAMFIGDTQGVPVFKQNAPLSSNYAFHNRKVYRVLLDESYALADEQDAD